MSKMLYDILDHAFVDERDIAVTRESSGSDSATDGAPDVVLVGGDGAADDRGAATLLERWPDARIISIMGHGRQAYLYELHPQKIELGQLSPGALVQMVRTAMRGEARASARPACHCGQHLE
jgi:hypothetical protein